MVNRQINKISKLSMVLETIMENVRNLQCPLGTHAPDDGKDWNMLLM